MKQELPDSWRLLDSVQDEESFLRFVRVLASESDHADFEHPKTGDFLEACVRWCEGSDFGRGTMDCGDEKNVWQLVARFLISGKTYE